MKARRTYGATDNIVLEFWIGDHFMGEEFAATRCRRSGSRRWAPAPSIGRSQIIRNNRSIYRNGGG